MFARGSDAQRIFGLPVDEPDDPIVLCGPFEVRDRFHTSRQVLKVWIENEGDVLDVFVELDNGDALTAGLAQDAVFLAGVLAKLAAAGFGGPAFAAAHEGLQGSHTVVLAANPEFTAYARTLGFLHRCSTVAEMRLHCCPAPCDGCLAASVPQ